MGFDVNRFIGLGSELAGKLTCHFCNGIFNNPINTSCGHTFCKPCVQQIVEKNGKECPNCKIGFTKKRTNAALNDDNLIVVRNYVFSPNLVVKSMINELKIKCDYEPHGCKALINFRKLTYHLEKCEHRLCPKCGLTLRQIVGHNCIELLRKNREDLEKEFNEIKDKNIKLEEKIQKIKTKNNKSKQRLDELMATNLNQSNFKDKYEKSQTVNKILADKVLKLEEKVNTTNEWKNLYLNQTNNIRDLNQKMTKLEEQLEKNANRETELKDEISYLENEVKTKQNDLELKSNEIQTKNLEIEELRPKSDSNLKQRYEKLRDDYSKLLKDFKRKDEELKSKDKKIEFKNEWKEKYEKCNQLVTDLKQNNLKLKDDNNFNRRELKILRNDLMNKKEELRHRIDRFRDNNSNFDNSLITEEDLIELRRKIENRSKLIIELDLKNSELSKKVELNDSELKNVWKDRTEWKDKYLKLKEDYQQIKAENLKFIERINELKEQKSKLGKEVGVRSHLKLDFEKREQSFERIESQLKFELDSKEKFILSLNNQLPQKVIIRTDIVLFGTHLIESCKVDFSSDGILIYLSDDLTKYLLIKYNSIKELMYCSDPILQAIVIEIDVKTCGEVRNRIGVLDNMNGWFDVESEDPSLNYIIIKFFPKTVITSDWISLILYSFQTKPQLKCQLIDLQKTTNLLESALKCRSLI